MGQEKKSITDPATRDFLEGDVERKDRESLSQLAEFHGLAELLMLGCEVVWAGIVVDHYNEAPLWVAVGPEASALARSELLWRLGREARDLVCFVRGSERGQLIEPLVVNATPLGSLVIAPVFNDVRRPIAFVWLADRRASEINQIQRRVVELIVEEVRLRYDLRQRLLEKLDVIGALRKIYDELRATNKELVVARDRALEGERAKAVFLTNLGHELRTPLNAILGFTEIVLEEAREVGKESLVVPLEHVLEASHRLSEMIENALYVARVDTKRMPLYLETFDLGRLLTETVEAIRPLATKRNNELTLTLPSNLGTMHSDPAKVRQIVYNLLNNACKFTENGKVSLSAARLKQADGEYVRIVVADTGPGLSKELLERMFDDFMPSEDTPPGQSAALGVGLAVVTRFCKLMDGSIRVVSRPGYGTRMLVTLPVHLQEKTPFSSSGTLKAVTSVMPEPPKSAPFVLVVESDQETRDLICAALRRANCRVQGAERLAEVLQIIEKDPPQAITLDVNLEHDDGWHILGRLRSLPATVNVPILLVTETVDHNLALEVGATDVISKPVSPSVLVDTIRRWLRSGSGQSKEKPESP
ncbi:MAG: hybrid sensor histidine kinase/response regulator [Candidatus Sumerlaeaceae bacterium]|nr:hybrid sensor histidine kinase/response regulator [Candidatus Sumerlaeaceae bacterium]